MQDWIWYELMTTDVEAAGKFYGDVVGWRVSRYPGSESAPQYWVGHVGERGVAGMMSMPPGVPAGMKPNWGGYIRASDVDGTAKAITEAGGSVLREPWDIAGVGRIAVVADPQHGVFQIMQPAPMDRTPAKLEQNTPGNVSWCELHSDTADNLDFYLQQFGWKKTEAVDMGEYGSYQMFTTNEQDASTGGSMVKIKGTPEEKLPTYWLFYFSVDGIDAAIARVGSAGGNVFMGPHQVPGGDWIALGTDPQGATFALHSRKK